MKLLWLGAHEVLDVLEYTSDDIGPWVRIRLTTGELRWTSPGALLIESQS